MITKTLIASAVAGALSFPIASFANDSGTGVMGSSVQSQAGPVQTQAGDLTFSQGIPSSSIAASQPESVTWYYPDGSVVQQYGTAFVAGAPASGAESSASIGSSTDSGPSQVTWYYPDGSVMQESNGGIVAEIPVDVYYVEALELADFGPSGSSSDFLILSDSSGSPSGSFHDVEQLALVATEPSHSETWYFPDGMVMEQQTFALAQLDEQSASTGSSSDFLILSDASDWEAGSSWLVAEADPTFVIVTE